MKKILIIFFTIYTMLMVVNTNALVCEEEYEISIESKEMVEGTVTGMLRSSTIPTRGVDLSIQSYRANVQSVFAMWSYTDVYFTIGSNKTINVSYSLSSNTTAKATIGIYDINTGSWVKTTSGLSGKLTANNLNTSHKYAVGFKANGNNVINGSAIITN